MTIDEAVALYRKGRIATFTFEPDSIDMSYVERDVAEFRKGWVACVLNYDDASKDRISQLESEIAELRKDRERLERILTFRQINWMQTKDGIFHASVSDSCNGWAMLGASSGMTRDEAIDAAIATAEGEGGDNATSDDR